MITVSRGELLARVDHLRAGRTPFVLATVVRAERPTSAKPGDCALVLADGTVDGFVGGVCAESTVRTEGLRLLRAGASGLLRITPDAGGEQPEVEGLRTVGNPCLSGGTLEIFLEAMVPPTLMTVFGEAPVARALVRLGTALDYDMRTGTDATVPIEPDTAAVVVASHGRDETPVLTSALRVGVPYVALVASRKRAAAVRRELVAGGVPAEQVERIHAPAGLDVGARSAPEIALSVFAEIVASRPRTTADPPAPGPDAVGGAQAVPGPAAAELEVAVDPVCGMSVAAVPASLSATVGGRVHWFCGSGCRQAFLDDPARFGGEVSR